MSLQINLKPLVEENSFYLTKFNYSKILKIIFEVVLSPFQQIIVTVTEFGFKIPSFYRELKTEKIVWCAKDFSLILLSIMVSYLEKSFALTFPDLFINKPSVIELFYYRISIFFIFYKITNNEFSFKLCFFLAIPLLLRIAENSIYKIRCPFFEGAVGIKEKIKSFFGYGLKNLRNIGLEIIKAPEIFIPKYSTPIYDHLFLSAKVGEVNLDLSLKIIRMLGLFSLVSIYIKVYYNLKLRLEKKTELEKNLKRKIISLVSQITSSLVIMLLIFVFSKNEEERKNSFLKFSTPHLKWHYPNENPVITIKEVNLKLGKRHLSRVLCDENVIVRELLKSSFKDPLGLSNTDDYFKVYYRPWQVMDITEGLENYLIVENKNDRDYIFIPFTYDVFDYPYIKHNSIYQIKRLQKDIVSFLSRVFIFPYSKLLLILILNTACKEFLKKRKILNYDLKKDIFYQALKLIMILVSIEKVINIILNFNDDFLMFSDYLFEGLRGGSIIKGIIIGGLSLEIITICWLLLYIQFFKFDETKIKSEIREKILDLKKKEILIFIIIWCIVILITQIITETGLLDIFHIMYISLSNISSSRYNAMIKNVFLKYPKCLSLIGMKSLLIPA